MPTHSYIRTIDEFKLNYIAIPLMLRFHKNRFALRGGLNFMLFSVGSNDVVRELSESGNISSAKVNESIERKTIKGDWGPLIGVEYNLFENLWLSVDFFYGLNKSQLGAFPVDRNMSHLLFGINYYLTKTNN